MTVTWFFKPLLSGFFNTLEDVASAPLKAADITPEEERAELRELLCRHPDCFESEMGALAMMAIFPRK